MKINMKWFIPVILAILLIVTFPACSKPAPTMSSEQVAAIIALQAVPSLDSYLQQEGQQPTNSQVVAQGEWRATEKTRGEWEIKGQLIVKYPQGDRTCRTTWTLSQNTGKIRLIEFVPL